MMENSRLSRVYNFSYRKERTLSQQIFSFICFLCGRLVESATLPAVLSTLKATRLVLAARRLCAMLSFFICGIFGVIAYKYGIIWLSNLVTTYAHILNYG